MATAQKALQAWQTRSKALGGVAASDLLAQEIKTGFSQYPLTQRDIQIILPPGGLQLSSAQWLALLEKLGTVQSISHRHTDGGTLLFH